MKAPTWHTKRESKIRRALRRVNAEIASNSHGKYGAGLASEGYAGGYRDALNDVLLLLNGVTPNNQRGYWEESHYRDDNPIPEPKPVTTKVRKLDPEAWK